VAAELRPAQLRTMGCLTNQVTCYVCNKWLFYICSGQPEGSVDLQSRTPGAHVPRCRHGRRASHAFTLLSPSTGGPGLYGYTTSIDQPVAQSNLFATTIISGLGGPLRAERFGILGVCGSKIGPTGKPELRGLIAAQRRLIRSIHDVACERGW
jgi:hypothetical protein